VLLSSRNLKQSQKGVFCVSQFNAYNGLKLFKSENYETIEQSTFITSL